MERVSDFELISLMERSKLQLANMMALIELYERRKAEAEALRRKNSDCRTAFDL